MGYLEIGVEPPYQGDEEHRSSSHGGAFLAWEDLYVMVGKGKSKPSAVILEGLTGYAEPGEVLAIMGPSGSGKTTLLDALAGRLLSNMSQTGDIIINGRKQVLAYGTSAYATQNETLMTTLTVREAVYYSALLQLSSSMSKAEKIERANTTLKMMGLQDAIDKRIGGRITNGISNGQRRRVSICMEMLTRPRLLFLDEPTSGLDSAASYHVMSYICKLACLEQTTVVASIHQPSSDVFEQFQHLCLLSYGKLVYFGPTSAANKFFTLYGFPCPSTIHPSDHFLRTINNDFVLGGEGANITEIAIHSLVNSYKSSEEYLNVQAKISSIRDHEGARLERRSRANFVTQCIVLTQRSFLNMYRDPGYYRLRLVIYITICSCVGVLFHNLDNSYDAIQARAACLSFIAGFVTFMAIGGFPSFVEDMKIFGRERLNGHYGVSAYVISNTLSSMPYLFIISFVPGALGYYLSGLQRGFDKFVYFGLVLFIGMTVVESLMMMVASVVPDFLMGITIGAGIQAIVMLHSGVLRPPSQLPKVLSRYPLYYIAYGTYGNQGLYKTEFQGLHFKGNFFEGFQMNSTGQEILRDVFQVQLNYSKWVDLLILLAMVVVYRLIFFCMIKVTEIGQFKRRCENIVAYLLH